MVNFKLLEVNQLTHFLKITNRLSCATVKIDSAYHSLYAIKMWAYSYLTSANWLSFEVNIFKTIDLLEFKL